MVTEATVTEQQLLKRVEETAERLRVLLEPPDFQLTLIVSPDEKLKKDWRKQFNDNEDGWHWDTYIHGLEGVTSKFIVAAYQGETLTGLCLYNRPFTSPERLNIQAIEGKRRHTPLKGYTTPIFNQLSVAIAKKLSLREIGVLGPEPNTVDRHTRVIDYQKDGQHLVAQIDENTQVIWNAQFEHQKAKGLYVPRHAR